MRRKRSGRGDGFYGPPPADPGDDVGVDAGSGIHPHPSPPDAGGRRSAPLTYDGLDEHPGCIEPPCCNGGSSDTNIEVTSKCKYLVRAYWLCGCYRDADRDEALRACVAGYVSLGEQCSGMNCGSIENCSSLYDDDLSRFYMPPFAPGCDRSERHEIMLQVYQGCR